MKMRAFSGCSISVIQGRGNCPFTGCVRRRREASKVFMKVFDQRVRLSGHLSTRNVQKCSHLNSEQTLSDNSRTLPQQTLDVPALGPPHRFLFCTTLA